MNALIKNGCALTQAATLLKTNSPAALQTPKATEGKHLSLFYVEEKTRNLKKFFHFKETSTEGPGSSLTIPGSSVTIPISSVTIPGSSVAIPGSSVIGPGSSVAIPGSSVRGPGSSVTIPKSSVNGPGSSVGGPGSSVTGPRLLSKPAGH